MHYAIARKQLLDRGYIPLPIIPNDKRPALKDWTGASYVPPLGFAGCGVGIICGRGDYPIAALDIDITDKDISQILFTNATDKLGLTAFRVGKAPKTLLIYRHAKSGIRKITSKQYDIGRIEVLGDGQQFVAYGTHPDTKKPYEWPSFFGDLLETPINEIPIIPPEQFHDFIKNAEGLIESCGYKPKSKTNTEFNGFDDYDPTDPLTRKEPLGLTAKECKARLDKLDPDCQRDEWRNVGMALHHEFKGSPEGLALWDEWSAKGTKYKEGEPEKQWASFGSYSGRPLTSAYLLKLTKEQEAAKKALTYFDEKDRNWNRLDTINPPEIPMVIYGFLPKNIVSLFYSAGGAGKSTLLLYMAAKIALADTYPVDFLGHAIEGGVVSIVTAEDPDLILSRRGAGIVKQLSEELNISADEINAKLQENLYVYSTYGDRVQLFSMRRDGELVSTAYFDSLLEVHKNIPNLQLIIVDTKTRYSSAEGQGNVTATQEIQFYETLVKEARASVMLLHHSNKSSRDGSQTGAQAYRDATAIFDSVRAAWYLRGATDAEVKSIKKSAEGTYLILENSKNNYIACNEDIMLHRVGYCYTPYAVPPKMTPTERKEQRAADTYNKILSLLQTATVDYSQAGVIRLCKEEKIGRRLAVGALEHLEEDGLITRGDGCGRKGAPIVLTALGQTYNLSIGDSHGF